MKYDYLVVGCGLFGVVFARKMVEAGRTVLIIDKRDHIGGNVYTSQADDYYIHVYGPHLFHTGSRAIWDYVNRFTEFNHYQHKVKANYKGQILSLPFNMMTYYQLWGCTTPKEAMEAVEKQKVPCENPRNLEEWALSQVGTEIYEKLIYGYTRKQWMRDPKDLPSSIIRRLPLRFTYDENYYNDAFQGVPKHGYSHMIENIIDGIEVRLGEDFFETDDWHNFATKLVYSGCIDRFFNYKYGHLEYRSLEFRQVHTNGDFQGCGQMNYTDLETPYTRSVEHKHFYLKHSDRTVVTFEYPVEWQPGKPEYYPVNDDTNNALYEKYREEAKLLPDVIIGGRLGSYRYYDMDQVIAQALHTAEQELSGR